MSKKNIGLCVALVITSLFSGGCVVGIGSSRGHHPSHPTVGQEFVDLKKARDSGALTEEEYAAQKQKLLAH